MGTGEILNRQRRRRRRKKKRKRKRKRRKRKRKRRRRRKKKKKFDLKNRHIQNRSCSGLIWTNIKFVRQYLIQNLSIYEILKLQNGSTAIFIKKFKRLMMTNVGRNM
jgi:hypothetical protein